MPVVRANPTQFLLTGRQGQLVNRGSAVQTFLRPGTVFVLVPSTKQEAAFEFSQETSDGIPLRFKGIVIYRITDPVAAARLFDFSGGAGVAQVSNLLTHVVLGELRHAVSHMTMVECIEQRKTTLSGVVEEALAHTVHPEGEESDWGITIEVAQLAQVFIVDAELRRQLEAETRNEIKLKSDQSDIQTAEESKLSTMASGGRVAEKKLEADREDLRRAEELEVAHVARQRRREAENLASQRQALEHARELHQAEMATEEAKTNAEAPVRLLKIARESEVLREELAMRELRTRARTLEVEHDLLLPRAEQEMRREMLPLEQAPEIVEAAAQVFQGANLAIYGDNVPLLGQLGPLFEILGRAIQRAAPAAADPVVADSE
jgi:regulator of protease activity HflC (stomatin/prohibitin superfamily)